MKKYIFPLLAAAIIAWMVFNEYQSDAEHHAFFVDVRDFIKKGGRNTAEDGFELCTNLNTLIAETKSELADPVDCDKYRDAELDAIETIESIEGDE